MPPPIEDPTLPEEADTDDSFDFLADMETEQRKKAVRDHRIWPVILIVLVSPPLGRSLRLQGVGHAFI